MRKVVKENKVERYICDDIALAIPACAVASSKWNPKSGRDSCVVRVLEIPDPCFPPTFEKSREVKLIIYKAKGNAILNMSERKSEHYKEELLGEFHASIMVSLQDSLARESLQKMEKGDPGFTECFKYLALGLRVFSFTLSETPVPPTDLPMEDAMLMNDGDKGQVEALSKEAKGSEGNLAIIAPEIKSEEISPKKVGET